MHWLSIKANLSRGKRPFTRILEQPHRLLQPIRVNHDIGKRAFFYYLYHDSTTDCLSSSKTTPNTEILKKHLKSHIYGKSFVLNNGVITDDYRIQTPLAGRLQPPDCLEQGSHKPR